MRHECFWKHESYTPLPSLTRDDSCEYLIVGGGIAGLFTAYHLLEAGVRDIVLIEKNRIASGQTGHAAGMLIAELETASWGDIVEHYGLEAASAYYEAHVDTQRIVRSLIQSERIECEYDEEDLLYIPHSKEEQRMVLKDAAVRARMGAAVSVLQEAPATEELRMPRFQMVERVDSSLALNPLKFAHGFAAHLRRRGVRIYESTELTGTDESVARTPRGAIRFTNIIYAIGMAEPSQDIQRLLTTICVTRALSAEELDLMRLADKDMVLDFGTRSYHYGKVTHDNRLLIGYGDSQYEGREELHMPHVRSVEKFLERAGVANLEIEYAWSSPFTLSRQLLPLLAKHGSVGRIGGAGAQISSGVIASCIVSKFLHKSHALDRLFPSV